MPRNGDAASFDAPSPRSAATCERAQCKTDGTNPSADRTPAYFASAGGDVVATIDDDDIRIESPCRRIAFEGPWARSATRGDRFYGALLVGTSVTDAAGRMPGLSIRPERHATDDNRLASKPSR